MNKRLEGQKYEATAEAHLMQLGYIPVLRNYRSPYGEIDLIMRRSGVLYFIEVKYRRTHAFGSPRDAIGRTKRLHLKRTALHYMGGQSSETPFHIAFLGIEGPAGALSFDFIEDIFV